MGNNQSKPLLYFVMIVLIHSDTQASQVPDLLSSNIPGNPLLVHMSRFVKNMEQVEALVKAFKMSPEDKEKYFGGLKWPVYASEINTVRDDFPESFSGGIKMPRPDYPYRYNVQTHMMYASNLRPDNLSTCDVSGRIYPFGQNGLVKIGKNLAFYDCDSREWSKLGNYPFEGHSYEVVYPMIHKDTTVVMASSDALVTVGGLLEEEPGMAERSSTAVTLLLSPTHNAPLRELPVGRLNSAVWVAKGDDGIKNVIVASGKNQDGYIDTCLFLPLLPMHGPSQTTVPLPPLTESWNPCQNMLVMGSSISSVVWGETLVAIVKESRTLATRIQYNSISSVLNRDAPWKNMDLRMARANSGDADFLMDPDDSQKTFLYIKDGDTLCVSCEDKKDHCRKSLDEGWELSDNSAIGLLPYGLIEQCFPPGTNEFQT